MTAPESGEASPVRRTYRRGDRLTHARQYDAVHRAKVRKSVGPLVMHSAPNDAGRVRLGLSIGRRVGGAVVRNRLKRMLREAFRLSRDQLPTDGYDLVISARAHEPLSLEEYRRLLVELAAASDREWKRRASRNAQQHGTDRAGA